MAAHEEEIIQWYYLTGGTALSEFYLRHRLSEDLDFFTTSDVNDKEIDKIIDKFIKQTNATEFEKRRISGLYIYQVKFPDGILKIDFNSFPYEPVERGIKHKNLNIDSFYDIAINKTYTILSRFQTRDFIDLYFMLLKDEFSLEQLITRVEDKYGTKVDTFYLGSQFLKVIDLPRAYPKMLKPFNFEEMVEYFKNEAKRLGAKVI